MMMVLVAPLLLALVGGPEKAVVAERVAAPAPARTITPPVAPPLTMPNAFSEGGADCPTILRQVEARRESVRPRDDARTLDREPMAFGFLAVDRNVDGCRQVTFLSDERGR